MIKKNKLLRFLLILGFLLVGLIVFTFIYRLFSLREIDDVTLGIECTRELLDKSDILWVIPLFENKSIADDSAWCDYILSLNKTLGMHGVYHTYREFGEIRDEEYVREGMNEFEKCFGFRPKMFKPPQMYFDEGNKYAIEYLGMSIRGKISQVFHKAYHCSDTGVVSNRFMDLF